MSSDLTVVIAAAGIGSRLGMNLPKAMVDIHGRTVLERLLTDCLADVRDIRLVVGFRADEVMAHARSIRKDIIMVRNPAFRDTSVRHSFWLASRHAQQPCLFIDGDMLIDPASLQAFRQAAEQTEVLVGVSPSSSEDVYADVDEKGLLRRFSRQAGWAHEWCGVAKLPPALFQGHSEYVFECIERVLPAPAFLLKAAEVDTRKDLEAAKAFARQLDAQRDRQMAALAGA
jgi:choline kinase